MSKSELKEIVSAETIDASFDSMIMVSPLYEFLAKHQPELVIAELCAYATFL